MKAITIIACIILSSSLHAQNDETSILGPQGGGMKKVQKYYIELVNSISRVSVYLYDSSVKPVPNDGVLSSIVFCYPYDECLNKGLTILGDNGYTVSVTNSHFIYCEVNLIVNGQPLTTKFTNISKLAESK